MTPTPSVPTIPSNPNILPNNIIINVNKAKKFHTICNIILKQLHLSVIV